MWQVMCQNCRRFPHIEGGTHIVDYSHTLSNTSFKHKTLYTAIINSVSFVIFN